MDNKEKGTKLICAVCGQPVLKNPNISGKPYAVRLSPPIICDVCSQTLASIDDENQSKLEAKNYAKIVNKSQSKSTNQTKPKTEAQKVVETIKLTDIISTVKNVIKGQDEQVKTIATSIYKNYKLAEPEIKSNLIVLGDSGSGKTEIIKLLANEFKVPYVIEDATRYTEAGYVGASVEDMIYNLFKAAGDNIIKAQKGILVIDEGDKKGSAGDSGRDVSGENVLFSLLKTVEGTKVPISDSYGDTLGYLDTSMLTIIFIGAFPGLNKIRDKRLKKKGVMGFGNNLVDTTNLITEYIAEDFIEGGFPKEFIGRFDTIVEMSKLTVENFEDIIINSSKSTFVSYKKVLENKGIELIYSDDVITEIAHEAERLKTGARGIKNVVQNMFKNIMFEILTNNSPYKQCEINKQTIVDPTKYSLS